jgi:hypothetical protein
VSDTEALSPVFRGAPHPEEVVASGLTGQHGFPNAVGIEECDDVEHPARQPHGLQPTGVCPPERPRRAGRVRVFVSMLAGVGGEKIGQATCAVGQQGVIVAADDAVIDDRRGVTQRERRSPRSSASSSAWSRTPAGTLIALPRTAFR